MKECRHHLDPDACELCQEHIREVAAKLGARGGEARKLTLSPERRTEIARIAAQQKWRNVIWDGVAIGALKVRHKAPRPYEPHSAERREKIRAAAQGRWADVPTKRKAIEAALAENPQWDRQELATKIGCTVGHVTWVGTQIGLYRPMSHEERTASNLARRRARGPIKADLVREMLTADPNRSPSEIARELGMQPCQISVIRRKMGLPRLIRERTPKPKVDDLTQARLEQDPGFGAIVRQVMAHVDRGYRAGRIAQLMDIPVAEVRAYIKARGSIQLGRMRKQPEQPERLMTAADVEAAAVLWREGATNKTIAERLGFNRNQVSQRLRRYLRDRGEK